MFRRLALADVDAAAIVHRSAFDHAVPWLAGLHTREEDRRFFRERVLQKCDVWGAVENGRVVGIVAFRNEWIDQLCVLPHAQRRGVGTELLNIAKRSWARLHLWTFQRNVQARLFYEARQFVMVKETDGLGNEEKEPDALYLWVQPHGG
jgi:ribosomal protein S18 acetylase RimI-like enzyme